MHGKRQPDNFAATTQGPTSGFRHVLQQEGPLRISQGFYTSITLKYEIHSLNKRHTCPCNLETRSTSSFLHISCLKPEINWPALLHVMLNVP